jgi:ATP-binding cassette subfamily B protein
MTRGKWAFDSFGDTLLLGLLPAFLIVIGMLIIQTIHWPMMGLAFAIGFSIYITSSVFLTIKYAAPAHEAFNKSDSHLGGVLADSITCNAVVKAFGSEDKEDQRFADESETWADHVKISWSRGINVDQVQSMLMSLMLASIMMMAIWRWSQGLFTPGDVGYTMTSYFIVSGYLRNIGGTIRQLQKSLNEMEDVIRFDKMTLDLADRPDAKALNVDKGSIAFKDVTFSYENQNAPVYQNFSVDIKSGEKLALVGHSGSGKSTFVKLLQRLYDVDAGHILIDGQNVADVTQQSLRQAVSLVPQDPVLFHRTLGENIAYGRPGSSMDDIRHAAKLAYADDFICDLTDGYNTMVGERGIKLSGGDRQGVAIARAILADKPILIMDEATSSLDSISEHIIQEAMKNLIAGRTTIMIAHRLSTIKEVDRILVFDKGKIVEQGTHEELLTIDHGYYKKLFDMQSFGFIGADEDTNTDMA